MRQRGGGGAALPPRRRCRPWPFAFEGDPVLQTSRRSRCTWRWSSTNLAEVAQPIRPSAGTRIFKRARSRRASRLAERWDDDATGLPVRKGGAARHRRRRRAPGLDNCFDGWHGAARIRDERFSLQLSRSSTVVVYTGRRRIISASRPVSWSATPSTWPTLAHGLQPSRPGRARAWMQLDIAVVCEPGRAPGARLARSPDVPAGEGQS